MISPQTPITPRSAGLLTVQLGPALKLGWTQWCAARNLLPSQALRALVEQAISGNAARADPPGATPTSAPTPLLVQRTPHPDRAPKVGREIQFTASENEAIQAVATAHGFGFQDWVIAAARAALAKAPSYGQADLEALTLSNARLAAVAADLSSLRRQEDGEHVVEEGEALAKLEAEIRDHIEVVSAAMAQGAQRWQLKI